MRINFPCQTPMVLVGCQGVAMQFLKCSQWISIALLKKIVAELFSFFELFWVTDSI